MAGVGPCEAVRKPLVGLSPWLVDGCHLLTCLPIVFPARVSASVSKFPLFIRTTALLITSS